MGKNNSLFPIPVTASITDAAARAYIKANMDAFLDNIFQANESVAYYFITENEEDVLEFAAEEGFLR